MVSVCDVDGGQRRAAEQRGDVLRRAPGEDRLAGARRVGRDRAPDLEEQAHAAGAGDLVDVDDVAAFEHDEVRRLAGLPLNRLKVLAGGGVSRSTRSWSAARELEQLVADQVAAAGRVWAA